MRGEEVSREIPFIFSRALSRHAAGERVGRAGAGFVCGWKRGGSRGGGLLGGRRLFPSRERLNRRVEWKHGDGTDGSQRCPPGQAMGN